MTTPKRQRMKTIRDEIKWYEPKKRIADAMLALGELGFEFSGHGVGLGGEDLGLWYDKLSLYFNFCDRGNKVVASITDNTNLDSETEPQELFEGTIGQAMKFITKRLAA